MASSAIVPYDSKCPECGCEFSFTIIYDNLVGSALEDARMLSVPYKGICPACEEKINSVAHVSKSG